MKRTRLAVLVSGLLLGAAVGTASAVQIAPEFHSASPAAYPLAKNGADDPLPPACDDHGTDVCVSVGNAVEAVAKNGADDPLPPACDDHGTDVCVSKA